MMAQWWSQGRCWPRVRCMCACVRGAFEPTCVAALEAREKCLQGASLWRKKHQHPQTVGRAERRKRLVHTFPRRSCVRAFLNPCCALEKHTPQQSGRGGVGGDGCICRLRAICVACWAKSVEILANRLSRTEVSRNRRELAQSRRSLADSRAHSAIDLLFVVSGPILANTGPWLAKSTQLVQNREGAFHFRPNSGATSAGFSLGFAQLGQE